MKILLAFFVLTIVSCEKRDKKDIFVGNWSFCDQRGLYNEIHVNDTIIDHHWKAIPEGAPFVFEISNDTLRYFNPNSDDSTWHSFRLDVITNDHLRLSDEENSFDLNRITMRINTLSQLDSIKEHHKKLWILREDFLERFSKSNCKDSQTPSEILADSLSTKHFLDSTQSAR